MGGPQGRFLMPQCCVSKKFAALPDSAEGPCVPWMLIRHDLCMDTSVLTRCCALQPSLPSLLAKPNMGMKDSIFASTNGQTRKLRSYFPDPTMDIDNKVRCLMSIGAV